MNAQANLVALTRVGFAARGILYLIIAWLIIRTGNAEDMSGAMQYLDSGNGRILLYLLIAGFIAYGIWRLADALLDTEGHGDDKKAIVKRLGAGGSGVIYLFLAYQAYKMVSNSGGSGGGSGSGPEEQSQTVMQLPGGELLLTIAALVLAFAGVWQMIKAIKASFLDHLSPEAAHENWIKLFGQIGYASRSIIFLVSAWFLLQAATSGDSSQAGGMEEALQWMSSPINLIVAAGLALFGIFSILEARYRMIHAPDPAQMRGQFS